MYSRSIMASFHGIWSLAGFTGAALATLLIWIGLVPWQHFVVSSAIGFLLSSLFANSLIACIGNKYEPKGFSLPNKRILLLGAIAFGNLVCEGTMFDWSGVYFKKVVQAPTNLTALGYAAFMGCMATGRFFADKVVSAIGSKKVLRFAGVLVAAGFALAVAMPYLITATVGFMLVGFGVCSVVPIVYSLAGQSSGSNTGRALAGITTVGFAGFLAGPPLVGFVAQATNLRWSFALVACIGLLTSMLALYLRPTNSQ
jgi:MFS family permease